MKWFGMRFDAPVYDPELKVPVPVGQPCVHCGEVIKSNDNGFIFSNGPAMHSHCLADATNWGGGVIPTDA